MRGRKSQRVNRAVLRDVFLLQPSNENEHLHLFPFLSHSTDTARTTFFLLFSFPVRHYERAYYNAWSTDSTDI